MTQIVKRKGHEEKFDERKLYASIFAACMTLRMTDEEAETISTLVTDDVKKTIAQKKEIPVHLLHTEAAKNLKRYHPEAGYMYDTHKDIF